MQPTQSFKQFCDRGSKPGIDRADHEHAPNVISNHIRHTPELEQFVAVAKASLGNVHINHSKLPTCPRPPGLQNCSFSGRQRDTREQMLLEEQTLLSAANTSEAGGCNLAL